MKPVIDILEERISAAMAAATGEKNCAAIVKPSIDQKFGDYQANGVMALAKKIKTNPHKLAEDVAAKLDIDDICEKPEIAGPGFINLRLKNDFLSRTLLEINSDTQNRFGIDKAAKPQTVVVDFSGPNIAKQMHVGHLRSTIIGDCICRMLKFAGHKTIPQNHIGDWGTQFGMLIAYRLHRNIKTALDSMYERNSGQPQLSDWEEFYKKAKQLYDTDSKFADESRQWVGNLQKGERTATLHWQSIVDLSRKDIYPIYKNLNVKLERRDERSESFYNEFLPEMVKELRDKELAVESEGAICVFPKGFEDKDGRPLPLIIQKSDGAFLYATTDLAAIRYRVNELKADKIIYVTDARQKLHFEMVFAAAKMAGWNIRQNTEYRTQNSEDRTQNPDSRFTTHDSRTTVTEFVHVTFGSVLGEDGKPFKTRSGESVKLKDLLDEAIKRAKIIAEEKNPDLPDNKKDQIANAVGIGALKYADYSNNRTSDYIFSFDKMLAMEGNTAPYMQYAYARIKSIEKKSQTDVKAELANLKTPNLSEPAELDLARHLIRYGEVLEAAVADYRPNYLTSYLYELAQKFSVFYTNCPVLKAEPDKKPTRLLLCDLTAKTIRHGLSELLGIEVIEQM